MMWWGRKLASGREETKQPDLYRLGLKWANEVVMQGRKRCLHMAEVGTRWVCDELSKAGDARVAVRAD
jgi:hypothetical protein